MKYQHLAVPIREAYELYRTGTLFIPLYQRDFVWGKKQQRSFIESILEGQPCGAVLLARTASGGEESLELVDGQQRLRTIFQFIDDDFRLADDSGAQVQNGDPLSPEDRVRFLEYPLAITILSEYDEDQIASIIENINMKASPLSSQELRRVKARAKKDAGDFHGIVEHVSEAVRRFPLSGPAGRSAGSREKNSAGPNSPRSQGSASAPASLWRRLGIFTEKDVLRGADQELVARILYSVLTEQPVARSQDLLDSLYAGRNPLRSDAEKRHRQYGAEKLRSDALRVFSLFSSLPGSDRSETADNNDSDSFHQTSVSAALTAEAFYLLYIASFQYAVKQGLQIHNPSSDFACLADGLRKMRLVMSAVPESDEACRELVDYASFLIRPCFASDGKDIRNSMQLEAEFETSLCRSLIETSLCEFKQGFLRLSPDRLYDRDLESRILQTLCGMANIGSSKNGTLYIGIADKESDANKIARLDSVDPICYMEHYVVGIQREAALMGISVENYCHNVEEFIDHSPLSRHLVVSVLSQMDVVDYRGFTVIRLIVPPQDEISYYGDDVYLRKHSMTIRLSNAREIVSVSRKFR